jgi:hypothetical protein
MGCDPVFVSRQICAADCRYFAMTPQSGQGGSGLRYSPLRLTVRSQRSGGYSAL